MRRAPALATLLLLAFPTGCEPVGTSPSPGPSTPAAMSAPSAEAIRGRRIMLDLIQSLGVTDLRVITAMRDVPRHEFVPPELADEAYADTALPIGFGQTISQPYVVALMTELLDVQPGDTVLEVGTGSGYQAAILAELTDSVYTVEIIPELASAAADRLERLGYGTIVTRTGDGYFGWSGHAPFDGIIVTAAPDHVPPPLLRQLAEGGHLIIPVGPPGGYQTLWRITKRRGEVVSENITGVLFVPLVREPD